METLLVQCWYPITVATNSYHMKVRKSAFTTNITCFEYIDSFELLLTRMMAFKHNFQKSCHCAKPKKQAIYIPTEILCLSFPSVLFGT